MLKNQTRRTFVSYVLLYFGMERVEKARLKVMITLILIHIYRSGEVTCAQANLYERVVETIDVGDSYDFSRG